MKSTTAPSSEKAHPLSWVLTAYVAEGVPFAMVIWVAGTALKNFGHSDTEITVALSSIGIVWSLKPFWAGLLDTYRTKKFFVLSAQIALASLFGAAALVLGTEHYFGGLIVVLWGIGIASATQDICIDGIYVTSLSEAKQSRYIGVQGMAWNLGRIIAVSAAVWLAGYLQAFPIFSIRTSWMAVFGVIAGLMAFFAAYHARFLPVGRSQVPTLPGHRGVFPQLRESALDFCDRRALWGMLAFVLFFRSAEGLLLVEAPLFLQGCLEQGGLQLSLRDKGFIDGTVGSVATIVGGLLGGAFIARFTLKRTLFVLAICVNAPNLCYVILAYAVSPSSPLTLSTIAVLVGFEKFWYGFGFVGNMLYMMQQMSPGRFRMTHYAFATALMNLVLVPTQMVSGPLADSMGFRPYFWLVTAAALPSLIAAWFAPFPHSPGSDDAPPDHAGELSSPRRLARTATALALVAIAVFLYVDTMALGFVGTASSGRGLSVVLGLLLLSSVGKVWLAFRALRAAWASLTTPDRHIDPSRASNSRGALVGAGLVFVISLGIVGVVFHRATSTAPTCPPGSAQCPSDESPRKDVCDRPEVRRTWF